jgi:hypothetical protein
MALALIDYAGRHREVWRQGYRVLAAPYHIRFDIGQPGFYSVTGRESPCNWSLVKRRGDAADQIHSSFTFSIARLQAGRSRVQIPMGSLDCFQFTSSLQPHYSPGVDQQSSRGESAAGA